VNVQITNSTTSTVMVGADATHDTGVAGALVELFSTTTVHAAKKGSNPGNKFFGAPAGAKNTNILVFTAPSVLNFNPV